MCHEFFVFFCASTFLINHSALYLKEITKKIHSCVLFSFPEVYEYIKSFNTQVYDFLITSKKFPEKKLFRSNYR